MPALFSKFIRDATRTSSVYVYNRPSGGLLAYVFKYPVSDEERTLLATAITDGFASNRCRECFNRLVCYVGMVGPNGPLLNEAFDVSGSSSSSPYCAMVQKLREIATRVCGQADVEPTMVVVDKPTFPGPACGREKGATTQFDHFHILPSHVSTPDLARRYTSLRNVPTCHFRLNKLLAKNARSAFDIIERAIAGSLKPQHWSSMLTYIKELYAFSKVDGLDSVSWAERTLLIVHAMLNGRISGFEHADFQQATNYLDFSDKIEKKIGVDDNAAIEEVRALANSRSDEKNYQVSEADRKLAKLGIKSTAYVNLEWNRLGVDFDLHAYCMDNSTTPPTVLSHCFYNRKQTPHARLNFDAQGDAKGVSSENITCQPGATYVVTVHNFNQLGGNEVPFTVTVQNGDTRTIHEHVWIRSEHVGQYAEYYNLDDYQSKSMVFVGEFYMNKEEEADPMTLSDAAAARAIATDREWNRLFGALRARVATTQDPLCQALAFHLKNNAADASTNATEPGHSLNESYMALARQPGSSFRGTASVAYDSRSRVALDNDGGDDEDVFLSIEQVAEHIANGYTVYAYPRDEMMPGYLTVISTTGTSGFEGSVVSSCAFVENHSQAVKVSRESRLGGARLEKSWFNDASIFNYPVRAVRIVGVYLINGVSFIAFEGAKLPVEDEKFPIGSGCYATDLGRLQSQYIALNPNCKPHEADFHVHRARYVFHHTELKPTTPTTTTYTPLLVGGFVFTPTLRVQINKSSDAKQTRSFTTLLHSSEEERLSSAYNDDDDDSFSTD